MTGAQLFGVMFAVGIAFAIGFWLAHVLPWGTSTKPAPFTGAPFARNARVWVRFPWQPDRLVLGRVLETLQHEEEGAPVYVVRPEYDRKAGECIAAPHRWLELVRSD